MLRMRVQFLLQVLIEIVSIVAACYHLEHCVSRTSRLALENQLNEIRTRAEQIIATSGLRAAIDNLKAILGPRETILAHLRHISGEADEDKGDPDGSGEEDKDADSSDDEDNFVATVDFIRRRQGVIAATGTVACRAQLIQPQ